MISVLKSACSILLPLLAKVGALTTIFVASQAAKMATDNRTGMYLSFLKYIYNLVNV